MCARWVNVGQKYLAGCAVVMWFFARQAIEWFEPAELVCCWWWWRRRVANGCGMQWGAWAFRAFLRWCSFWERTCFWCGQTTTGGNVRQLNDMQMNGINETHKWVVIAKFWFSRTENDFVIEFTSANLIMQDHRPIDTLSHRQWYLLTLQWTRIDLKYSVYTFSSAQWSSLFSQPSHVFTAAAQSSRVICCACSDDKTVSVACDQSLLCAIYDWTHGHIRRGGWH